MKRPGLLAAATLLLAAASNPASAQEAIAYTPVACVRAGQMPHLQMRVEGEGLLRAYFRPVNTQEWCSVDGTNQGPLSRVTLPKFENGQEIEYFFVLLDGARVAARTPSDRPHRFRVTEQCETLTARHAIQLTMNCGDNGSGSIPASLGAGYAVSQSLVSTAPPYGSPDRPTSDSATKP